MNGIPTHDEREREGRGEQHLWLRDREHGLQSSLTTAVLGLICSKGKLEEICNSFV